MLTEEQIDAALARAAAEIDDDAADGVRTDSSEVMQLLLDGIGEHEGSANDVLIELVQRGYISVAWATWVTGALNGAVSRVPDISGAWLLPAGLQRGRDAAGSS